MNKQVITLIVLIILFLLVIRRKSVSRADMIDFLNTQVDYANGAWTKLSDEELKTVYKPFAMIKKNVKPDTGEYLQAIEVFKKYNIEVPA